MTKLNVLMPGSPPKTSPERMVNRMDHGPFVSCATGYPMDYATANKGLNMFLEDGWVASFDTGLLRVRCGKAA